MKSLTKIRKQRNYVFLQLIAMLSNLDKVFNLMSLDPDPVQNRNYKTDFYCVRIQFLRIRNTALHMLSKWIL